MAPRTMRIRGMTPYGWAKPPGVARGTLFGPFESLFNSPLLGTLMRMHGGAGLCRDDVWCAHQAKTGQSQRTLHDKRMPRQVHDSMPPCLHLPAHVVRWLQDQNAREPRTALIYGLRAGVTARSGGQPAHGRNAAEHVRSNITSTQC